MEDSTTMMKHGALVGGALFFVMLGMGQDSGTAMRRSALTGAAVSAYMITFGHAYAQFARDPETKVFDSEMMRLEERNVRETLKHGGGEERFNNCLVIKLQRASKYGNTCHDCAAELELAPGLPFRVRVRHLSRSSALEKNH
eukprot:scaffold22932_cov35-Phaeocystis_antarctica.AAC.2